MRYSQWAPAWWAPGGTLQSHSSTSYHCLSFLLSHYLSTSLSHHFIAFLPLFLTISPSNHYLSISLHHYLTILELLLLLSTSLSRNITASYLNTLLDPIGSLYIVKMSICMYVCMCVCMYPEPPIWLTTKQDQPKPT